MNYLEILLKGRFRFSISKKLSRDAKAAGLRNTLLVIKDQENLEVSLYMMTGNCGAVLVAYWSSISLGSNRHRFLSIGDTVTSALHFHEFLSLSSWL